MEDRIYVPPIWKRTLYQNLKETHNAQFGIDDFYALMDLTGYMVFCAHKKIHNHTKKSIIYADM